MARVGGVPTCQHDRLFHKVVYRFREVVIG
jgi:hypothetical protein